MDKDKVIEYAMNSPYNMNRAVLESLLDSEDEMDSTNKGTFLVYYYDNGYEQSIVKKVQLETGQLSNEPYTFEELEELAQKYNLILAYSNYNDNQNLYAFQYVPKYQSDFGEIPALFHTTISIISSPSDGKLTCTSLALDMDAENGLQKTEHTRTYTLPTE